jgi:4-hydroxybenzoate polyprenyltransferase
VLCCYFALSLSYSTYLKQFLMIDVVVLACLYGLRVVAGGVAVGISLSEWLVAFCVFFFVSLALVKRSSEIKTAVVAGSQLSGRGYKIEDLPVVLALAGAAGFVSVLVLALYLDSENVRAIYSHPTMLWGVGLILVFWIGRVVLIAGRGDMHDDPVVFAVTDRISLLSAIAAAVILVVSV